VRCASEQVSKLLVLRATGRTVRLWTFALFPISDKRKGDGRSGLVHVAGSSRKEGAKLSMSSALVLHLVGVRVRVCVRKIDAYAF